jgi:hypothetical protein
MILNFSRGVGVRLLLIFSLIAVAHVGFCPAAYSQIGDVDFDGDLDSDDANLLTAGIAAGSMDSTLDVDGNGLVDTTDLALFFHEYAFSVHIPLATALVDVDCDLQNTSTDYFIIKNNLGLPLTDFTAGNLFVDGSIDVADLSLYISRGGVIPEPASGLLMLSAGLLMLSARRNISISALRALERIDPMRSTNTCFSLAQNA